MYIVYALHNICNIISYNLIYIYILHTCTSSKDKDKDKCAVVVISLVMCCILVSTATLPSGLVLPRHVQDAVEAVELMLDEEDGWVSRFSGKLCYPLVI